MAQAGDITTTEIADRDKMNRAHEGSGVLSILQSLGPQAGLRLAIDSLLSMNHYYILGRSLAAPIIYPLRQKPDLPFLPLDEETLRMLRDQAGNLPPRDRRELLGRLRFHSRGFSNCYVMKSGGEAAYLQWLIYPEENPVIMSRFAGKFYQLSERQVMVENVFTFPRFRGQGLLPYGTGKLLEVARERGYASAICYIRKDNITSLNEFCRLGFRIMKIVREYKVFGYAWRAL